MTDQEFEAIVDEAFKELPPEFLEKIQNIDVLIEDFPDPETRRTMHVTQKGLLGLYVGIPLNKRSPTAYGNVLPDRIYLFKKNLEAVSRSAQELKEQIQRTLLHELGHYFGIDDKRLRELGY